MDAVRSPKSVELPADAISINSSMLEWLALGLPLIATIPLLLFEVEAFLTDVTDKSPKSIAFPSVLIVTNCMFLRFEVPPPPANTPQTVAPVFEVFAK